MLPLLRGVQNAQELGFPFIAPARRRARVKSPRVAPLARRSLLAVGVVTLVGAAVRLAMVETLPLVVTPDGSWAPEGRGYLVWAHEILRSGDLAGPALRTPGYPVLLAASYAIGGVRDTSVLWLQHIQGLLTVGLITLVALRWAGATAALVTGVLAALDPWHLLFSHYALTESSMVLAVAATSSVLLFPRTRTLSQGFFIGLGGAAVCLIRPTGQMLLPFFAAAYLLWGPREPRRLVAPCLAFALGLGLGLGPWLAFNSARGIHGLAVAPDPLLFAPMAYHRLLDPEAMPADVPDAVRKGFEATLGAGVDPRATERFLEGCDVLSVAQREEWSRRSLAAAPERYLVGVWDTLRWLLNAGRADRPPIRDELLRFVLRLTTEPPGQVLAALGLPGSEPAASGAAALPGGPMRGLLLRFFDFWGRTPGLPQLPLALLASAAVALCLWRGRWREAALLAGTLAYVAAHAVILHPWQRYTLPSEMLWYLSLPILAGLSRRAPHS